LASISRTNRNNFAAVDMNTLFSFKTVHKYFHGQAKTQQDFGELNNANDDE